MPATLPAVLRDAAARFQQRPALVEGDRTLSFAALLDAVRGVAGGYVARGLQPGERVVVWAPNSIDWVLAALAVSYAGGVLVPANSRYTGHEVAEIAERTDARLVIVDDGFLGRSQIAELSAAGVEARRIVALENLSRIATEHPDVEARADGVRDDDVADILFTSGTTGRSKGVMSAHRQTVGVASAWAQVGEVSEADRYLVVNPFFHSFGYKAGIVVGLLTGAALYPMATFDINALMELVAREAITVLPGAPTIFQTILDAPERAEHDLSSLRLAVTGAASVPVVLIERMQAELEIPTVLTAFGMTEAVVVTMCRPGDDAHTIATTNGRAVPGMEIRAGEQDELLVRGDNVMLGYLDDPEATAKAIDAEGWLHTGDVCRIDEAGNMVITDRLKDMYISGGFNVYPAEIEQELLRHPGVADAAVVGVLDDRLGEVGHAFIVRRDDALTAEDVLTFASQRLANFKRPRAVSFIDALPRNLSGKVLKNDLRTQIDRTP
ncbi:MAG: FadD3 family acyl-CoA ligase [Marmoricola sp.]